MSDTLLELDNIAVSPLTAPYPYADILNQLIEDYKDKVEENQNSKEIYKWKLIQDFQLKWNDDAEDFQKMLESISFSNLVYGIGLGVLKHITRDYPEEVRQSFKYLYNESLPLQQRIDAFQLTIRNLYDEVGIVDLPTHQDERSIATYLAFRYPEKYTLYKWSFYYQLGKALNLKEEATGKRYCHYLSIVKDFVENCINNDAELLQLKEEFLTDGCHPDPNNMILAQDILYQMLDQASRCSYWKIGSTAGRNGNSIWPAMKKNSLVSIGWGDLGDLNTRESLTKASLTAELQSTGHYKQKRVASRKAGEILDFYKNIRPGDVVIICEGETTLAIARVDGDYEFNKDLDFPHFRTVEWLTEPKSFKISDGPQTSVYKIKNPLTIASIERMINNPQLIDEPKTEGSVVAPDMTSKNIILYGPPGTGKTYNTIELAVELITGKKDSAHGTNKKTFDLLRKEGQIEFITFHQNYSYEDFVVGIKPDLDNTDLKFRKNEGVFYQICERAKTNYNQSQIPASSVSLQPFDEVFESYISPLVEDGEEIEVKMISGKNFRIMDVNGNSIRLRFAGGSEKHSMGKSTLKKAYEDREAFESKKVITGGMFTYFKAVLQGLWEIGKQTNVVTPLRNYVLIIDEINRANISRVFGELITLLEEDKRLGAENELRLTLPDGEQNFALPPNLCILGTMNTADKSIALVDIALRRRFEFRGFYPTKLVIDELSAEGKIHNDVPDLLAALNKKIFDKKGADFLVGHAYFINKTTDQDLYITLKRKVIPLLMEYFSGKVDLVHELFRTSGYEVSYDSDNYDWTIAKA